MITDQTTPPAAEPTGGRTFDLLSDIPLRITAELGRTTLTVKKLLQLGAGAVVELDKLAGEPLDLLVNGQLVAPGEAVLVYDKFGIRLTDIVSRSERLARLG